MRRLLAGHTWAPVRVRVVFDDDRWEFTTADGTVWRSGRYLAWPPEDWVPAELSGHDLPDEDPGDVSADESAWWVSDGSTAVLSAAQGLR